MPQVPKEAPANSQEWKEKSWGLAADGVRTSFLPAATSGEKLQQETQELEIQT